MPGSTEIQTLSFIGLISDIKSGKIRIPEFQRDYIWSPDQIVDLLDSVYHGYPVGSVLIWKTTDRLNERNPLGLTTTTQRSSETQYLLDGQQRLISLYAILHNNLNQSSRLAKYIFYFNLKDGKFYFYKKTDLNTVREKPKIEDNFVAMPDLLEINYQNRSSSPKAQLITKFSGQPKQLQTFIGLANQFSNLEFPTILTSQDLPVACKIFERLNNTGTQLTIVDLMVAVTYNTTFNLRTKLNDLISSLESNNFAISEKSVLQCAAAINKKEINRESIIESRSNIASNWKKTTQAIRLSLDFVRDECSVISGDFLPYEIVLAPLSYFFYKKGNRRLNAQEISKLKKYFWTSSLAERYIQGANAKVVEDIKNIDTVLTNPSKKVFDDYYDNPATTERIINAKTSGSSFTKAILCFFAQKRPLEFSNSQLVNLMPTFANVNLKQLHHIFPVNFIETNLSNSTNYEKNIEPYINSIANIALITASGNNAIRDRAPSVYFNDFLRANSNLTTALHSHFIDDLASFGITQDNFETFLKMRSQKIADEVTTFVQTL